ncbi:MAG: ribonuclease D [Actinomycetota bacterium]|nr:ribonuclease D [Actinomycetota bacterium]
MPKVADTPAALSRVVADVAAGSGPVALDAERASGYRYSARAYLVQLRREGTGTALIDPIAFDDLTELDAAIGDAEWILHAATQDLPCLAAIGLRPRLLFDTEHAGRLLNLPRVGLAALVETLLGFSLAKEHSAADWSTRPLPETWLEYAALDVEVLLELREAMIERLTESGKLDWAYEDFDALTRFTGPPVRAEPWRRTSGLHKVRSRRALEIVRRLWLARDQVASSRDIAPGRVLPDAVMVAVACAPPADGRSLRTVVAMRHRAARRNLDIWGEALDAALATPDSELPHTRARVDGPPPVRSWPERDPAAAVRLAACRALVTELCETYSLPAENLLTPDLVRRIAWEPPEPVDEQAVSQRLRAGGARPWQVGLTTAGLTEALHTQPVAGDS